VVIKGFFQMAFGTRLSLGKDGPRAPAATQETCPRCRGTGHVRERGQRLICKACAGTGRVTVAADRKTG